MTQRFQTVGLFGKYKDPSIGDIINALTEFLRGRGHHVLLVESTAAHIDNPLAETRPLENIGKEINLAIVVGGDGTMLNVARVLVSHRVPLLGVNLGRLGFLTDIPGDDMTEALTTILDGDFELEERDLLDTEIMRGGKIIYSSNAFNDTIISKAELSRLIEFEIYIDGEFVNSMRADGVIVATPTGSTAYALSAGGPILDPTLSAMVIVPICPHTLSDRPIVVGSDSVVEVLMTSNGHQAAQVTLDGQSNMVLDDNDRIYIRRSEVPIQLIHQSSRNHYDVLRAKLHWG
ncbi:MAG TPA: NAD(+) kinase [Acidiferrobacteraceae bacterium]|nr:NAD(+) kinase [Acidiferrobacteraceae bacterium]